MSSISWSPLSRVLLNSNIVKEEDFAVTKFCTIRFNLEIMEFGKRYTREKKDKSGRIFILTITDFASKAECIFFKRKTSFLTELIFAEKTLKISCFEPNGIFKILMKSDLHFNCFSTSDLKVGVRTLRRRSSIG